MSPKNKNDNPIQSDYEDKFNALGKAEKKGNINSPLGDKKDSKNDSGIGGLKNAEESPLNDWKNNVSGAGAGTSKIGGMAAFKKKSPIVAIILTLVGGGIGIGGLLSPSLLLVNLKEVMANKFNNQLTSMDVRSTKLTAKKMGTVKGICGSKISVKCKYATMSKKQIKNFKKAGIDIDVDPSDSKTLLGRTKVKGLKYEGKTILPKNLMSEIKDNPRFRSAIKVAYNPKFAGFADAIWSKAANKLGISKLAAKLTGKTDAEKLASVQETTKKGSDIESAGVKKGDRKPGGGTYTEDEAAEFNAKNKVTNEAADSIGDKAAQVAKKRIKSAPALLATVAGNTLKVTGYLDDACTAYGAYQAVGFAAKAVRVLQLARYAMIFLNVADQIKAGTAKSEDVSYLGTVLNTESPLTKKTATSSFGYNFAAYGDRGKMSDSAAQYLAAAGLTGSMVGLSSIINQTLGGSPKTTCKTLANPFVAGVSIIVGIASMFIPGAAPIRWGALALAAGKGLLIATAIAFLPAILEDIIAGVLVDKTTVGEDAGDAITSGASGIMGTTANTGGNAPLTPTQAVAYAGLTKEVLAQYAEEDRLAYSPFDITNGNTFMGSIVARLIPYASNMSSLSGVMTSIASLTTSSFASMVSPSTKAASVDDYTMCTDLDYSELGIATDPYCNVTYGIPPEALDADPDEVAQDLINRGEIKAETDDAGEAGTIIGSGFQSFISDCIDRSRPIGDSGDDWTLDDGSRCMFNESNKNYYIYYIDQRVQTGMDAEEEQSSNSGGTADPGDSSKPVNTAKDGSGWTLKTNTDYSDVPCAEGTTDLYVFKTAKGNIKLRVCQMPDKLTKVVSLISKRTLNMIKDAAKDGITLKAIGPRSSFRSYADQVSLRKEYCSSGVCKHAVALPGYSEHEKGVAIDFENIGLEGGGKTWNWLKAHARDYGFINLPSEGWHWSTSGG